MSAFDPKRTLDPRKLLILARRLAGRAFPKPSLSRQGEHCNGKPLNRMLTIHLDKAGIADPVKATGQLLKLMGDWLRSSKFYKR
jgi:hypothetical protein